MIQAEGNQRRAGVLLIELGIYFTVFAVVMSPLGYFVLQSTRAHAENDALLRMSERCRVSLQRIASDLRGCQGDTITISDSGNTIQFTLADSYSAGALVNGDVIQYTITKVTDTAELRRSNLTTNEVQILTEWLDIAVSHFAQSGSSIIATLEATESDRLTQTVTRSVTVTPRN